MLDLHCHILFDIDDGPETLYESMRLCRMASENGIEGAAATSHLYSPTEIDTYLRRRHDRMQRLGEEIERTTADLRVAAP